MSAIRMLLASTADCCATAAGVSCEKYQTRPATRTVSVPNQASTTPFNKFSFWIAATSRSPERSAM